MVNSAPDPGPSEYRICTAASFHTCKQYSIVLKRYDNAICKKQGWGINRAELAYDGRYRELTYKITHNYIKCEVRLIILMFYKFSKIRSYSSNHEKI
jgi:hypothetical protein